MKKIESLITIVNRVSEIGAKNLSNEKAKLSFKKDVDKLLNELSESAAIKVPIIGDFSAGKSTLLNSFMGTELLPTNILPETAVSYELYYAEKVDERLELYHQGELKDKKELSQIKEFEVVPGNIVKVYINNEKIKELNEQGIVLVDMPGVDSGIEAHNNAILNYIQEGSFFIIINDVEQGTLRTSTISFIKELKQYGLASSIIISKADKKPDSELKLIKEHIGEQAKQYIGEEATVGSVSAPKNDFKDFEQLVYNINAEDILEQQFKPQVINLTSSLIGELSMQAKLMTSNTERFDEQIAELKAKRDEAINQIKNNQHNAQTVDASADDIVQDIKHSLENKGTYFATLLFQNKNTDELNAEILSVIRPVLVNSFKRELAEYQANLDGIVKEFALGVNNILQDKDNVFVGGAIDLVENVMNKDFFETIFKKALENMMKRYGGKKAITTILSFAGKSIGPVITIAFNLIPDVIRIVFGKSREQKIETIKLQLSEKLFGKIADSMKPQIITLLEEQRSEADSGVEHSINSVIEKFNNEIESIIAKKNEDAAEQERILKDIYADIEVLRQLIA